MGLFKKLDLPVTSIIDWEMTPEYTFGTFESWGGKERVRSSSERIYYFFIDNWGERPRLCLMERGIKHARVVAEIQAPENMIQNCVNSQGKVALFERSFAIDTPLRRWLEENIVESDDDSLIIPLKEDAKPDMRMDLPHRNDPVPDITVITLPDEPAEMDELTVSSLTKEFDFFDCERNPSGRFTNYLVDNGDGLTVTDLATGLMWQREGFDIMSHRMLCREIDQLNKERFGGFSDWRMPTMAEALSLLEPDKNEQGQHIAGCFSARQPFIFAAAFRSPGGYWFVDYQHGRAYWASGTNPGGFGRVCRKVCE
ncbi:MAG: hypothetical protein Kow0089_23230 [Desulfobulbaceae bacterium]